MGKLEFVGDGVRVGVWVSEFGLEFEFEFEFEFRFLFGFEVEVEVVVVNKDKCPGLGRRWWEQHWHQETTPLWRNCKGVDSRLC